MTSKRDDTGERWRQVNLRQAGDLFENPTHILHNQRVVGQICVRSERISPPSKTQDHQKNAIRPPTIEVVKREVIWEWVVGRRPLLPSGWLDCEPPREDTRAELPSIYVVTTGVFSRPLLELSYLSGPVAGWKSLTNGLEVVNNVPILWRIECITNFGYPSLAS